ncbi:helicase HerA-like domain-containing protein [Shimazuella kribbensis]|uniref:helicase HerA-like domain-containing protein n=1 Tax=Shimazuella kribbensis TaxID=139808 RepID=UPI000402F8B6|nr:helicase HerA-like domain-containing protein [Shimazuella kribbensis]
MFGNDDDFMQFQQYQKKQQGGVIAMEMLGALFLLVFLFVPLVISIVLTIIAHRQGWKPAWFIWSGLVLNTVGALLGFFNLYFAGLMALFKAWFAGVQVGKAGEKFWAALPDSLWTMTPASITACILLSGLFMWFIKYRPELLPIPVKPPKEEKPVVHKLSKLTSLPTIDDGVVLGLDDNGKPVPLYDKEVNMHVFVSGATGAGKTNTLTVILESAIRRGKPVIIVDGKGDISFLEEMKEMSEAYGREFQGFSYSGDTHYNPFRHGRPTELKDKMMAMEEWSEPYYKRAAERYLQLVFRVLQLAEVPVDLHVVQSMLVQKNLMNTVKKLKNLEKEEADNIKEYINGLDKGHKDAIDGLKDRLALLTESDVGELFKDREGAKTIDLLEAVKAKRVAMLSLSGLSYSSFTPALGAMIVEDLKSVASALVESGREDYIYVILDEFNLFAGEQVVNMINKSRAAGFCCFIATQELADLSAAGGEELVGQVIGNTNVKIVHRQDVPDSAEYLSNVVGTHKVLVKTTMTEEKLMGNMSKLMGTVREDEELVIHPNVLKNLRQGEAMLIKKIPDNTVVKTQVRPAPQPPSQQVV